MKYIFLILLFLTSLFSSQFSKEVLLLHSYHKGYKWTDDISAAIEEKLAKNKQINLTTVYMDTKKVSNKDYYKQLKKLYTEQFKNRKIDLLIVSDNNALDFVNENHEKLFPNVPVLFTGINNYQNKLISNLQKVSGVVEQVDLEKNFSLIKKLHANLETLYIINDDSNTGLEMKKNLDFVINKYSKFFKIEYINNTDISEIKNKIKNVDKNDVILFVLLHKDKVGNYFTYKDSLTYIRSSSDVPIYGLWDFYLNHGVVGGLLTSARAQGEAVSDMAIAVLSGKDINEIPILMKSPNRYIFDYNEMKRFNIEIEDYLDDVRVLNLPSTIYSEYKEFVVLSVLSIITLIILVITMRANIKRRIVVERDLLNRIEFDKVLLDTIPNPIYYKNIDGKFIGCNLAFANLMKLDRKEVIGKTAYDFYPREIALKNTKVDEELLQTLGTNTSEMALHMNYQNMKYFILNKAVYKNIDGSVGGIVCIMDDITERVQQKQFLIQQSKLAEMGDMVAAIAHQWNEPLVELSAQVQDIQTSYLLNELKDSEVEEFVKDSMVQIKYMSQTLSDFRNFLKPSTKKKLFSIKNSLDEINEIIGKQVFYSNIDMRFVYVDGEELLIYGYENEFKQVLLNLINNAKNKIIEKDENGKIIITISKSNEYNKLDIYDDGGEIDNNIINSIFEPYFTTRKDGTGLGLYMAKVIIEDKMQGHIDVKNVNGGVKFTIKLPTKERKGQK